MFDASRFGYTFLHDSSMSIWSFPMVGLQKKKFIELDIPKFAICSKDSAFIYISSDPEKLKNVRFVFDYDEYLKMTKGKLTKAIICDVYIGDKVIDGIKYCSWCMQIMKDTSVSKHRSDRYTHNLFGVSGQFSNVLINTYSLIILSLKRKHSLDEMNDHYIKVLSPILTEDRFRKYIIWLIQCMKNVIKAEIATIDQATLHMDGWVKFFGYEGVQISYTIAAKRVTRFLGLLYLEGQKHNVTNMTTAMKELIKEFHLESKLTVFCGDSTNFNPAFAKENDLIFDPCKCHQISNVFKRFQLPPVFQRARESCIKMHQCTKFREYMLKNHHKSIIYFSEIRWLSIFPMIKRLLESIDSINEYMKEEADKDITDPKKKFSYKMGFNFNDNDMYILQGIMIYMNEVYEKVTIMESDKNNPGYNENLLGEIIILLEQMRDDTSLNDLIPRWKQNCESLLLDFKLTFFESDTDACKRNVAAGLFFADNDKGFYYHDNQVLINRVIEWMCENGHKYDAIVRESRHLKKKNITDPKYMLQYKSLCPNTYAFASYLSQFPGNNASIERAFSVIAKIILKWRTYQPAMANSLAIISNNWDIATMLIFGSLKETESFLLLSFDLYNHFFRRDTVFSFDFYSMSFSGKNTTDGVTIVEHDYYADWKAKYEGIKMVLAQNMIQMQWIFFTTAIRIDKNEIEYVPYNRLNTPLTNEIYKNSMVAYMSYPQI